jgi:SulP family sulfate permease
VILRSLLPILRWAPNYQRVDLRSDLAAGVTVGAMLVPQAMAYALLAGLPPEVGLYASTIPVIVYALFGTSRQLAVGPVAIVSLLTASALGALVEEGTAGYLSAAALLALVVGLVHLVLGIGRLGYLVNFLSHAVLVGFTSAAAIIIGFSQAKHLLGVSVPRTESFFESVREVLAVAGEANGYTVALTAASLAVLFGVKRWAPLVPGALVVVVVSVLAVEALDLQGRGVAVVGDIPDSLPVFGLPDLGGSLVGNLLPTAFVITLVGFMESVAVAKVYARRYRYEVDANRELIGLGAANMASGLFGGYPVTGGFSRTAVNDTAGARTPLASLVTASIVLATIAFFTPLLSSLPRAALGAIIVMAVIGLIDVAEMRHIATVKRSDLISLGVAFVATLVLGIEIGIGVAVVASMLVVFARMSMPHTAVLGRVEGTTSYRNIDRFPEAVTVAGARIIRIDAALTFVNAANIKKLLVGQTEELAATSTATGGEPLDLVLDASAVNDLDATGAEMIHEVLAELEERGVTLHLAAVRGPVRDVLRRAGLWDELGDRVHLSTHDAVIAIGAHRPTPPGQRRWSGDERSDVAMAAAAITGLGGGAGAAGGAGDAAAGDAAAGDAAAPGGSPSAVAEART